MSIEKVKLLVILLLICIFTTATVVGATAVNKEGETMLSVQQEVEFKTALEELNELDAILLELQNETQIASRNNGKEHSC